MNYDNLIDTIKKSKIILIGYQHNINSIKIKEKILSNFSYLDIDESDYNLNSISRDRKIDCILNNTDLPITDIYHLDLNNIVCMNLSDGFIGRSKIISDVVKNLAHIIQKSKYRLILETNVCELPSGDTSYSNYTAYAGGRSPLYVSDLAIVIYDSMIKVVKNRYGETFKIEL